MKINKFIIFSLLPFLAASCSKKYGDYYHDPVPITFDLGYNVEVKGSELTGDNISSFGVFAALEMNADKDFDNIPVDELQLFMNDVPVNKDSDGCFISDPVYYWPFLDDKQITFFAYAPHSKGTGIEAAALWGGEDGQKDKSIQITYTMATDPRQHVDLCIAQAVVDRVRDEDGDGVTDPVQFQFKHALASVTFAANYIGEIPEGCYMRIDELVLNKFVNTNSLTYNYEESDFFQWDELTLGTPKEGTAILNTGRSTLSENAEIKTDVYTDISTLNGVVYMLPQSINPAGTDPSDLTSIDLTFSCVKKGSLNSIIAQFYTSIDIPVETQDNKIVLEAAKKYKFLFTIDVTDASLVDVSCVEDGDWLVDWADSGNAHKDTLIK